MDYVDTEAVIEYTGRIIEELQEIGARADDCWETCRSLLKKHSDIMVYNGTKTGSHKDGVFTVVDEYAVLYTSPDYMYKFDSGDGIDKSYNYFIDSVRRLGYACEKIIDCQGDIDTYYQEICNLLDGVDVPAEAYSYTDTGTSGSWVWGTSPTEPEKEPVETSSRTDVGGETTTPEQQDTYVPAEDTTTTGEQDTYAPAEDTTTSESQESSDPEDGHEWISTGDPVTDLIVNGLYWGITHIF